MLTIEKLQEEAKPYINTLVIDGWNQVVRLVGVGEDEDDFYWIYDYHKTGITYHSVLVGWVPLKGILPKRDYDRILNLWNLNNEEKAI